VLGLTAQQATSLVFVNRDGITQAALGVGTDGKPALTIVEH
jgi:hypothetical protein